MPTRPPILPPTTPENIQLWALDAAVTINSLATATNNVKEVTANYTVEAYEDALEVDTTGGNITVSLPAAAKHPGRLIFIKRMTAGVNTLTIDPHSTETIDGAATLALSSQYEAVALLSDSSNWIKAVHSPGGGGTTTNALTMNNGGAGAASGTTFDGSVARTISYNTIGAAASSHTHAQADVTGLTTADSPQFAGINLGHASDTTLTRVSAGVVAVEGVNVVTTAGGVTFAADISVPAEAYGSGWNGSNEAPTKNDVYDKIESLPAPGLKFIGSYAPSAVASLDIENFAGLSGYDEIVIAYHLTASNDSSGLNLRFKLNGTYKSGASDYKSTGNLMFSATTSSTTGTTGASSIGVALAGAGGIGSNAVEGVDGEIVLANPFGTDRWKRCRFDTTWIDDQAAQRIVRLDGAGAYSGATSGDATGFALGGVQLLISAGTMTGNVYVYGRVNA